MLDSGVEGFGRRILREAEDVTATDARQPPGPCNEQKAQGPHAPEEVRGGALPGAAFGFGDGIELEAEGDVVSEDAQLLPRAVGAVVAGRDDIEGELALEFRDRLLLSPPAADERVERGQRQGQVGGDRVVLEVPVVRGEQIQLEVLGAQTCALPIDRKSTRLNSSHGYISYAVFCLKKKKRK